MSNITFVLFTKNEENRIENAILNFLSYGEVLVMDGGSTDQTRQVAERLGAKFFLRPKNDKAYVETYEMFEFVKKTAPKDWVYWGYVDNMLPKSLVDKLQEISQQEHYKYVQIPIYTYLWKNTQQPMLKARIACFFRKGYMDFSQHYVHGMGKFTGQKNEILTLPMRDEFAIRHFSLYDVNKFIFSHMHYANEEAKFRFEQGQKFSKVRTLASMFRYFLLFFRYSYDIKDQGLLVSLMYSFFRLMVFFRVFELEHGLDLETIEAEFNKARLTILKDFHV